MTDHPTLLLIHGLGANNGVWAELEEALGWPGRVTVPDLPGHGHAAWTGDYSLGALAAALSSELDRDEPMVVVGHSLGGGVGLCLATGFFRPAVQAVVGIGLKVAWSADDVVGMAKVAERGVRYFDMQAEAVARFLRQSGLEGVVGEDHPSVASGVVEENDQWRVSQDPLTFAQQPLDMARLLSAVRCPVILGAGEGDAMVSRSDLEVFVDEPRIAQGRGHNVQVEDASWVAALVHEITAPPG